MRLPSLWAEIPKRKKKEKERKRKQSDKRTNFHLHYDKTVGFA